MIHEFTGKHYVKCQTCGACRDHIYAENDEQAIAIWNGRSIDDIKPVLDKQKWIFDKE